MRKSGFSKRSHFSARQVLAVAALGAALLVGREAAASLVWAFDTPATPVALDDHVASCVKSCVELSL